MFLKEHNLKENAEAFEVASEETLRNTCPSNLLFLAEGIDNSSSKEVLSARNLAEEYKIKVADPIINPFNTRIAKEASVSSIHGALSHLVIDYFCPDSNRLSKQLTEITSDELIRFSVDAVAKEFGVSQKDLRKEFSLLSFHDISRLQREVELLANLRQKLIDKSNIHCRKNLLGILNGNAESDIFVMAGGAHEPVFNPYFNQFEQYQKSTPCKELEFNQNRTRAHTINPTTQISKLQKAIKLSGIEILAAASHFIDPDWDAQYTDRTKHAHLGDIYTWNDFEHCENNPIFSDFDHSADLITAKMLMLVQIHRPKPLNSRFYSRSNLMKRALDNPGRLTTSERVRLTLKGMFKDTISNFTNSNSVYLDIKPDDVKTAATEAALTLRIIVEQIGDSLPPDEDAIIQKLLSAPVPEARNHGAWAAFNTSKHQWRNNDTVIWSLINEVSNEPNPKIKRRVYLAVISANPLFLFAKDENERFIIYKEKDKEIEKLLIGCAQENNPGARANAYLTIGDYLEKQQIENPLLDEILVKGLENKDQNVLYAVYKRMTRGLICDHRILPLLKSASYDSNWENRSNALYAISIYREKIKTIDPELKVIARNNFSHENEHVRVGATKLFGLIISGEPILEVQDDDILSLLQIANSDPDKVARNNATYCLSVIVNRELDSITEDKLDQVEHLCVVNRDPQYALTQELQSINEALNKLVIVNGLEEVRLLLELEGHPSKEKVEKLIRKKDNYRDAIGPLLARVESLYQANLKLVAIVEDLRDENLALREEGETLKCKIMELTKELNRIEASIKSKRVKRLLLSIGGTAFRNIAKGRGIAHTEFVKSIFIDAGWDKITAFIV